MTGFIQRELLRVQTALREPQSDERYCWFYVAQQALSWALDPNGFSAPYDTIVEGQVMPLSAGSSAGSEDCSARSHPPAFSGTDGLSDEQRSPERYAHSR